MSVATQSCMPASFAAGDTVRLSVGDSRYPATGWTLTIALVGNGVSYPFAGTADGNNFTVELSTGSITPGSYSWAELYTETATGERSTGRTGTVEVLANPAVTPTKSFAQESLELAEAAYKKLITGSNSSVSFNGQTFTKKDANQLLEQRDRLRDEVRREQEKAAMLTGNKTGRDIFIRFP